MKKIITLAIFLGAFTATFAQTPSNAQSQFQGTTTTSIVKTTTNLPRVERLWNLKDVDIRAFIHSVAEETGKNFIVDPRVTGKVTFISSKPLNSEELYAAFLSALQVNSFVALPEDNVIKIVPDYVAKGLSSPIYNRSMNKDGDAMAVAVVSLKFVPVGELATALNQFLTQAGHIAAYTPSNDLIVADRAGNIENLLKMVKQIDQQKSSRIEVIPLRNAQAKSIVDTIKAMMGQRQGPGGAPASGAMEVNLAADERTNSILIGGGSREHRMQLRSVIRSLDISRAGPAAVTEVIYLKHLHAERAAVIVNGLIQNYVEKKAVAAQTATNATSEDGGNDNKDASSLFNRGGMGNNNSGPMYGQNSGFYTSNAPDNEISSIIKKLPKSGSVSPAVQWEESTNSLVITAPRYLMQKIKQVIARLDIRRPQVLIEAVIAEVSTERQRELGIEWNTSGTVSFRTSFLPTLPLSLIGTDGKLASLAGVDTFGQGLSLMDKGNTQIRLLIRALEIDRTSNVLATPNLTTLDNEPAQIKVGKKISFATAQIQNNPTGGNPFNFFDREDVGLVLTLQPQITPEGSIKLLIQQELSTIIPGSQHAGGNPDTTERFVRTTVMADNGQILVLGGLLQNQWDHDVQKVPIIGDIPYFGTLFKSQSKTQSKTNLMIFLKPTILYTKTDEELVSGGKYEFLRQSQLQTDTNNPYRNKMVTPVMPKEGPELILPPPFFDHIKVTHQLQGEG